MDCNCDKCGIQIPDKAIVWELSMNKEIQTKLTPEEKEQYKITSNFVVETEEARILNNYCENCAGKFAFQDSTPQKSGLVCTDCSARIHLNQSYWAYLALKGFYELYAFEPMKNYVIEIYCQHCAAKKLLND